MGVYFETYGTFIKTIVKAIENINEECIFNFDSSGLHIKISDVYKYKMLELKIDKDDLKEYYCDNPLELGIVIDRIKDVTKTLKAKDTISFTYESGGNNLILKAGGLSRSVKLIDINMIGKVPSLVGAEKELSDGYQATIKANPLKTFLRAASNAISFDVSTEDDYLHLTSESDEGLIEIEWVESPISPKGYGSTTNYSVVETTKSISTIGDAANIRGCQGGVWEIKWGLGNHSYIRAMVAPRV